MDEAQPVPPPPPPPVASVPQENTPLVLFTSQLAALRPETTREVVEAVPETVSAVVEAYDMVRFPVALSNTKFPIPAFPNRTVDDA